MADNLKRRYPSPTEEDDENENALMQELERKARALRVSETGAKITKVPHQQPGFRRRKIQELDRFESFLDCSESEVVEMEVEEVCYILDGGDPDADLAEYIAGRSIEMIRKAVERGYRELNQVLAETIDTLIGEALDLGIDVDEEQFYALRTDYFKEDRENKFMYELEELGMLDAVRLVMKGRCELAWVKDNRDRLVDYVEEAKAILEANGTYELQFEFYPRATEIELLDDLQRDRVRAGRSEEDFPTSAQIEDGNESPTKRKKSALHPNSTQGAIPSIGAENEEDEPMEV